VSKLLLILFLAPQLASAGYRCRITDTTQIASAGKVQFQIEDWTGSVVRSARWGAVQSASPADLTKFCTERRDEAEAEDSAATTNSTVEHPTGYHTHTEAQVTNLTNDLAGKASSSHTHAEGDVPIW
jgi:hypothetical protein